MMDQDDESDEYSRDSDKEIFFNKSVKSMNDEMPEDNHQQFSFSPQKPTQNIQGISTPNKEGKTINSRHSSI